MSNCTRNYGLFPPCIPSTRSLLCFVACRKEGLRGEEKKRGSFPTESVDKLVAVTVLEGWVRVGRVL